MNSTSQSPSHTARRQDQLMNATSQDQYVD